MIDKDFRCKRVVDGLALELRIPPYVWMYRKGRIDVDVYDPQGGSIRCKSTGLSMHDSDPQELVDFLHNLTFQLETCSSCGARMLQRESEHRRSNECEKCFLTRFNKEHGHGSEENPCPEDSATPIAPQNRSHAVTASAISTRNLSALGSVKQLRVTCRAQAVCDLLVRALRAGGSASPSWEYCQRMSPYYSFIEKVEEGLDVACINNGQGDKLKIFFCREGAVILGQDHNAFTSTWSRRGHLYPGVFDGLPSSMAAVFENHIRDQDCSFCVWCESETALWSTGAITHEPHVCAQIEDGEDIDGSEFLLSKICFRPRDFIAFASSYYELDLTPQVVEAVYTGDPVTPALLGELKFVTGYSVDFFLGELERMGQSSTGFRNGDNALPANESMFRGIIPKHDFRDPWSLLEDPERRRREDRLQKPVGPDHVLNGVRVRALGGHAEYDACLFQVQLPTSRYAYVDFEAERNRNGGLQIELFNSFEQFEHYVMNDDCESL